jgi:hypothetical protein
LREATDIRSFQDDDNDDDVALLFRRLLHADGLVVVVVVVEGGVWWISDVLLLLLLVLLLLLLLLLCPEKLLPIVVLSFVWLFLPTPAPVRRFNLSSIVDVDDMLIDIHEYSNTFSA